MSKYQALTDHLKRAGSDHCPLTFAEIEAIIGNRLPPSAHKHRAWWSNNPANSVMTKAWLAAGWYSSDVDIEGQKLVFRRNRKLPLARGNERRVGPADEVIGINVPRKAMEILRLKADLDGRTIEQLAAHILVRDAHLSVRERLAIADRIRSTSPKLCDVDVPSMIREDRDRS